MIADIILASAPLGLVLAGAFLFIWGWALGGARSRLLYTIVVVAALSGLGSQIALGFGFARPDGVRTPELTLYRWSPVGDAGFGVSLTFRGDMLAWLFALPLALLALIVIFYLLVRRPHAELYDDIAPGRLFGLILLAEGAGLGAFYSADFVLTFFWLEAVGICLYLLSGPGLRGASAKAGSYRALGFNLLAGQAIFAALLVMISRNGGRSTYSEFIPTVIDSTLFAVLVAGCLAKAAQFPLQSWLGHLEDLPGAAYALISAGFVFPFAIYLPLRLQALAGNQNNWLVSVQDILIAVGALTVLFAAGAALRGAEKQRLTNRIGLLAAGQFGFIIIALGLGQLAAALQQLIGLMLGGAVLYLAADQLQIEIAPPPNPTNRSNPPPLGRPALFRPLVIGLYGLGAWNFASLPFSLAYSGRWQTLQGLLENYRIWAGLVLVGLALMLAALVQGFLLFVNEPRRTAEAANEENYWTLVGPISLALLLLVGGFYPGLADFWINQVLSRVQAEIPPITGTAPGGWLGLLIALGLLAGYFSYWLGTKEVNRPYNGGLDYERDTRGELKYTFARAGRSKMALKIIEKEEEMPEGFDDDFFRGTYKLPRLQAQAARRILPDPRLSALDFYGPLQERLRDIFKIFDTSYGGSIVGRVVIGLLNRTRRVFEWLVERFYPALAAFILLIFIILLTR